MAYASGYITVETEIDINDYDGSFDIEFDGIDDVIETAVANGYSMEEIIDHCFDEGKVNPSTFMQEYMTREQIVELYNKSITEQIDELQLTITNRNAKIRELEEKIAELSKSDEEVLEGVAY